MNPEVVLSLISDLYLQVTASQQRIAELERELAEARAETPGGASANGDRERVPVTEA
jgi:hypothetical protein